MPTTVKAGLTRTAHRSVVSLTPQALGIVQLTRDRHDGSPFVAHTAVSARLPLFARTNSGAEALIVIETGVVFAGYLPGRALRLIREWLGEHRVELKANWDRASAQQPTEPVTPLT